MDIIDDLGSKRNQEGGVWFITLLGYALPSGFYARWEPPNHPAQCRFAIQIPSTSSLVQILYSQLDCIRFGAVGVVKLLLATEKVDIDFKDSDGQTPLLMAARGGNERVVKLLQRS